MKTLAEHIDFAMRLVSLVMIVGAPVVGACVLIYLGVLDVMRKWCRFDLICDFVAMLATALAASIAIGVFTYIWERL
jgi:hypothetical protein